MGDYAEQFRRCIFYAGRGHVLWPPAGSSVGRSSDMFGARAVFVAASMLGTRGAGRRGAARALIVVSFVVHKKNIAWLGVARKRTSQCMTRRTGTGRVLKA
ncbi:MAG: hypothetical protein A2Y38_07065 [Spirochaetes bacterium GWB1_59_5]|nr:MAG: hypothetical protein A2Y38_07065 [Spirochaetes bacterium GWB1_59_5]